ncbi:MAG: 4'-phosphopantetheinyl transferase superfamily protein [Clostridia bacterium]|nr:4'-phosphopantetheinyl transferase superfamily protein [Clostridia bacterium]
MLNVYTGKTTDKKNFLNDALLRHIPASFEILRTENGKPYIKDGDIFFNFSDSGGYCAAAVSDRPVGVDIEVFKKGVRRSVLSTFCEREQKEIRGETDFLTHWTAREAYIKYCGGTLAHMLRRLSFTDGVLYCDGVPVSVQPQFFIAENYVLSLCGEEQANFIEL